MGLTWESILKAGLTGPHTQEIQVTPSSGGHGFWYIGKSHRTKLNFTESRFSALHLYGGRRKLVSDPRWQGLELRAFGLQPEASAAYSFQPFLLPSSHKILLLQLRKKSPFPLMKAILHFHLSTSGQGITQLFAFGW